ncbi:hypothetical protein [Mycetocola reblochoni]|uniref:hypothetical protein n=1 Tax=Mycetocola reblochoni TaxID=331618 RepID=UPI003F9AB252
MSAHLLDPAPLVALCRRALDAADLADVAVITDGTLALSYTDPGVVFISPPTIEFTTFALTDTTFELDVIQGTTQNLSLAQARIAEIIVALSDGGVNLATAKPATWNGAMGQTHPAYTLTLNPE